MSVANMVNNILISKKLAFESLSNKNVPINVMNTDKLVEYINAISFNMGSVTINPSIEQIELYPNDDVDGISNITVNKITSSIDSNITPKNIKNGVSILGITGTADVVSVGEKTITENGTYYASNDSLSGYNSINISVPNVSCNGVTIHITCYDEELYDSDVIITSYNEIPNKTYTCHINTNGVGTITDNIFGKIHICGSNNGITVELLKYINSNSDVYITLDSSGEEYDVWETWCSKANVNITDISSLSELCSNETAMTTLWSNEDAYNYARKSLMSFPNGNIVNELCKNTIGIKYMASTNFGKKFMLCDFGNIIGKIKNNNLITTLDNYATTNPTMTSNTTPSGTAFASSVFSSQFGAAYNAFDKNKNSRWESASESLYNTRYIGYKFTKPIYIYKVAFTATIFSISNSKFQISSDGTTYIDASNNIIFSQNILTNIYPTSFEKSISCRIYITKVNGGSSVCTVGCSEMQIYGIQLDD